MGKKVLCFDFDGVIASYDGWKGFDVLGGPNLNVIQAINELYNEGYFITIFTTRPFTQKMMDKYVQESIQEFCLKNNKSIRVDNNYKNMITALSGNDYEKWNNYPHERPYMYKKEILEI